MTPNPSRPQSNPGRNRWGGRGHASVRRRRAHGGRCWAAWRSGKDGEQAEGKERNHTALSQVLVSCSGTKAGSSPSTRRKFIRPRLTRSSGFLRCLRCSRACLRESRILGRACEASQGLHCIQPWQPLAGGRCHHKSLPSLSPSSVKPSRETALSSASRQPHKAPCPHPALCTGFLSGHGPHDIDMSW